MKLPAARGPLSQALSIALRRPPHDLSPGIAAGIVTENVLSDEDVQLSLFVCYELHYRGWDDVADDWEWQPSLLALRAELETAQEQALRDLVGHLPAVEPPEVPDALITLVHGDNGPSLARYLQRRASMEQFREFVAHRSVYHLKEADPHTFAIPRLEGRAKAALVEIQADEYGGGQLERMHAELFRTTMGCLGLDTAYGSYIDAVPALTLAGNNTMSLFGLHRRLRGALLGHLAAFEMTSSQSNRCYGNGLRRLGGTPAATRFYDEHVEADAVHEQIAVYDMCGAFATAEPDLAADVLFGAACAGAVGRLTTIAILDKWRDGHSSLRATTPGDADNQTFAERNAA